MDGSIVYSTDEATTAERARKAELRALFAQKVRLSEADGRTLLLGGEGNTVAVLSEDLANAGEMGAQIAKLWNHGPEVIGALLGAIGSLQHQVEQMRGMFDDADGAIQDAMDDAEAAYDAAKSAGF